MNEWKYSLNADINLFLISNQTISTFQVPLEERLYNTLFITKRAWRILMNHDRLCAFCIYSSWRCLLLCSTYQKWYLEIILNNTDNDTIKTTPTLIWELFLATSAWQDATLQTSFLCPWHRDKKCVVQMCVGRPPIQNLNHLSTAQFSLVQ